MTAIPENRKLSGPRQAKGYNNKVLVLYIAPEELSGTGTIYEQVIAFVNANVTIISSHEDSKINIIIGTPPDPEELDGYPYTYPYILS